jgi:hypothetical protein
MLSDIVNVAKKVRRSREFKYVIGAPKRLTVFAQQRANKGIFSVEVEANCGFFAVIQMILYILAYCEENSLYPDITAKGGLYGEKTATADWFGQLFEAVHIPTQAILAKLSNRREIRTSHVRGEEELGFRARYEAGLSLSVASALFNKYYRPSAAAVADVDSLSKKLRVGESNIGVHYRGTDKAYETGNVPWRTICDAVEEIANKNSRLTQILLASDDAQFIECFCKYPFKIPVAVAPASYMPKGDKPVHYSGHPGLEIGREALVTCLLLSRCGFLIKTPSYLSAWAKIFNPRLPVWLIAASSLGDEMFPDRALWRDQHEGAPGRRY